eukprot:EG_transcript_21903
MSVFDAGLPLPIVLFLTKGLMRALCACWHTGELSEAVEQHQLEVPAKPWTWGPLSLLLAGPLLAGVLDFRIPFALTFTLSPTRMVAAVAAVVCGAEVLFLTFHALRTVGLWRQKAGTFVEYWLGAQLDPEENPALGLGHQERFRDALLRFGPHRHRAATVTLCGGLLLLLLAGVSVGAFYLAGPVGFDGYTVTTLYYAFVLLFLLALMVYHVHFLRRDCDRFQKFLKTVCAPGLQRCRWPVQLQMQAVTELVEADLAVTLLSDWLATMALSGGVLSYVVQLICAHLG